MDKKMINKSFILILFELSMFACNSSKNSELTATNSESFSETSVHTTSADKIRQDSIYKVQPTIYIDHSTGLSNIAASSTNPEVTPLPFSGKEDFVGEALRRNPAVFKMPPIKSIKYFPMFPIPKNWTAAGCEGGDCIDTSVPASCADGGFVDTTVFKFKKYSLRLPDVQGLQSYISLGLGYSNYGVDSIYRCFEHYSYYESAYLVLYDSLTQLAKIVALHHPVMSHGELVFQRTFVIDKNFEIHIQDYGRGEEEPEPFDFAFDIKVLPSGEFEIKKILTAKK
jgi:hypothetical protein